MATVQPNVTGRRALRINEFCAAYGVSRTTAYKLIADGALPLCKVGGRSLIRVEDAEALLSGSVLRGEVSAA
jgi:excisionase family DNA binding protein